MEIRWSYDGAGVAARALSPRRQPPAVLHAGFESEMSEGIMTRAIWLL